MPTTELYREHLTILDRALSDALERAGKRGRTFDGVVFHAGRAREYYADDEAVPFRAAAHYLRYVPLDAPEHVVLARPGRVPRVVLVQPTDYWYDTAPPAKSYWQDAVDLAIVDRPEAVGAALGDVAGAAFVGESREAAAALGIGEGAVDPAELLAPLDWHRAAKTPYEIEHLRAAARAAGAGHRAARAAFETGLSERDIHSAYLGGARHLERELPFGSIVALDAKSAILHYQGKRGDGETPGNVLLCDAGARSGPYAADVTRTWVRPGVEPAFVEIVNRLDVAERELVAMVTPGRPYLDIHLQAHRLVAGILADVGIVRVSADQALARGLTRTFLPHGVGHHLGIQVHDVGGRQAGPDGGSAPPPPEHPYLRNTRTLAPGHVVTIEPGIYVIPMLLEPLRSGPDASAIDWELVDRLAPLGGVRIEDDVVCAAGAPEDLTREHCPGPRGV